MNQAARPRSFQHQATRFALLSAISFVTHLGITALLHEGLGLTSYAAVPITMTLITVMNFCVLRWLVFEHSDRPWWAQFVGFTASVAGFRVAEYASYLLLHGLLGLPYLPAYATVLAFSAIGKFLFLRGWVFSASQATLNPGESAA